MLPRSDSVRLGASLAPSAPARLAAARARSLLALATGVALALALGLSGLTRGLERALQPASGLSLEILPADPRAPARPVGTVELPEMPSSRERELPRFQRHVRFRGHWKIDRVGRYAVRLQAEGAASLRVDDLVVVEREASSNSRTAHAVLELAEGPHRLEVEYAKAAPPHQLRVRAGLEGTPAVALDPLALSVERPPAERVEQVARARSLARAARLAWSAALATAIALLALRRRDWIPFARRAAPRVRMAIPVLIVAWAAALRFESLVVRYWQPDAPWWAVALAERFSAISPRQGLPRWVEEEGYSGDPINYIQFGRSLQGFYDAHVREPVFVALTRAGLVLAGDRDLGVSFASALASTLLVLATYLLGRHAYSAPVGALAAVALAVDRHVIELSAMGWRDDTFALFVVLSVYGWLRLYDRPSFANALLAGLASGAAVLTRITALSFVLPVAAYVAVTGRGDRRLRLERWAIAVVVLGVVVPGVVVLGIESLRAATI